MLKVLAFLLILVILFGVATTRALVFGLFGIIFWAIFALFCFCLIVYVVDALKDARTPEQKAKDKALEKKKNREAMAANKRALAFWSKALVIIILSVTILSLLAIYLIKK